jgi:hypothetical protein
VKRSQRHTAACALAFAGVVVASPASAQRPAESETTRFEFRAPVGCSSADDFAARVGRRSRRIRLVNDTSARRSLLVEIQRVSTNNSLRGSVRVVEADGATRTRQLKAASCEEAVEALSLIATVTLDPDAMSGEPAPEEPPKPPLEPPKPPAPPPKKLAPPIYGASPSEPYRFSFGLAGALFVQMAPELVPGASVSAAFELDPGRIVSPFFRLSLTHAQRRGMAERGGQASFAFTLPTVDACPVRFGPRALAVRPCAFGTLGLLRAWGDVTLQNETHDRLYGAAGFAAWLGWRVSEAFEIIADGRVGVPFRRDEFAFDGAVFFKTPTLGFSAGLGLAGGFP